MTDSLGDIVADLLDEVEDIEVSASREYARGGIPFAWRPEEEVLELRLGRDIAEAALRTPDTQASERGDAWVRFAPPSWTEHARDRAEAWFRVAWRMAERR
jgi:hypothetical protein